MLPVEFENGYATVERSLRALEERVTPILQEIAEKNGGTLEKRIKDPGSAFEKFILGKYEEPFSGCEDLFGAIIVLRRVPKGVNRTALEHNIQQRFDIKETKSNRNENPFTFIYDDLHYVLQLKDDATLLNKELINWKFELQVKSYLQYAWAMSTHALSYKPNVETWRANRLVAETRALVELADGALMHGEDFLPKTEDRPYSAIDDRVTAIRIVEKWWKGSPPPENKRRLGEFVIEFAKMAGLNLGEFETMLGSDRAKEIATKLSINIHQGILMMLVENRKDVLIRHLRSRRRFILITQAMEDLSPSCKLIPADVRVTLQKEL